MYGKSEAAKRDEAMLSEFTRGAHGSTNAGKAMRGGSLGEGAEEGEEAGEEGNRECRRCGRNDTKGEEGEGEEGWRKKCGRGGTAVLFPGVQQREEGCAIFFIEEVDEFEAGSEPRKEREGEAADGIGSVDKI